MLDSTSRIDSAFTLKDGSLFTNGFDALGAPNDLPNKSSSNSSYPRSLLSYLNVLLRLMVARLGPDACSSASAPPKYDDCWLWNYNWDLFIKSSWSLSPSLSKSWIWRLISSLPATFQDCWERNIYCICWAWYGAVMVDCNLFTSSSSFGWFPPPSRLGSLTSSCSKGSTWLSNFGLAWSPPFYAFWWRAWPGCSLSSTSNSSS